MEATTVPKNQTPATPEEIWAILRETDRIIRENAQGMQELKEAQRETAEQMKETDRKMQETDRRINKLSKNVGGLGNSIGNVIETLFAAHLWEQFPEYDLRMSCRDVTLCNENREEIAEIDILLVNTEWVMAVEVKNNAKMKDIDEHIVRMERIQKYPPSLIPPQAKILGVIAAGTITPEATTYAHESGFFVVELKDDFVVRVPAPAGFKPKEYKMTNLR